MDKELQRTLMENVAACFNILPQRFSGGSEENLRESLPAYPVFAPTSETHMSQVHGWWVGYNHFCLFH
jgi:hypothetical protein